jgi:hypothetical protein
MMPQQKKLLSTLIAVFCMAAGALSATPWKRADNPLYTPWAEDVSPDNAWPEYPRPQMVRDEWLNLNGLWDYALEPVEFTAVQGLTRQPTMTTGRPPTTWQGKILVPFAIDSALSGVKHILRPNERLWYRRVLSIPASWKDGRILLHFQASDWETGVYVNSRRVGQHRGGYDPFSFDITDYLKRGDNELVVCVWDATEQQCQAIGKQIMPENRKGFRYQPTGGIWQTVWLERVAEAHIADLKMVPDVDTGTLHLTVDPPRPAAGLVVSAEAFDGDELVGKAIGFAGQLMHLRVENPKLWSPDRPFLYDLKVSLKQDGRTVDEVRSYFGMRKVEIKKAADGFVRIHLNNRPIFQVGPLDQGYWPDGILSPATDRAAKYDLEYLKKIGCNMVRVHVTAHPDRWYYWADKLGLLVWQDMVCMPKYGQTVDDAAAKQWQAEFGAMIDWLHDHPSIIQWVAFNEGWGQHDTVRYTEWIKQIDPSRLVINASGWADENCGDIWDVHDYTFYPAVVLQNDANGRAVLLGEAGGHNLSTEGHTWYEREATERIDYTNELGRMTFGTPTKMADGYEFWIKGLRCLNAGAGCGAVVYTQITDVEHELNGWLTYDRKVSKIAPERLRRMHLKLYDPPELVAVLGPGGQWKYTEKAVTKPKRRARKGPMDFGGDWIRSDFDDSSWKQGRAPFGHADRPTDATRTEVSSKVLYLRRDFELRAVPPEPVLTVTGRQNCHVYLNGKLLRKIRMNSRPRQNSKISYIPLRPDEISYLKEGTNTLAVAVVNVDREIRFDLSLVEMRE